jgi:hypothetical protein
MGVSERRACVALGQHRSTQRKIRGRASLEALLPKTLAGAMRGGAEPAGDADNPDPAFVAFTGTRCSADTEISGGSFYAKSRGVPHGGPVQCPADQGRVD